MQLILKLAVLLLVPALALGCSCIFLTFESHVDTAEILLRVRIVDTTVIGDLASGRYYYKAKVLDTFKGCNVKVGEFVYLRSFISSATCGVFLMNNVEYLIAGQSNDDYWKGLLVVDINLCQLNMRWNDLTPEQEQYLCRKREQCPPGECTDYRGFDFGQCDTELGWGIIGGQCRRITGCSDKGRILYRNREECQRMCGRGTCEDLTAWDFGNCARRLGVGVVNGQCRVINGCSNLGFRLWNSRQACSNSCRPVSFPGGGNCPEGLRTVNCLVDPCTVSPGCSEGVRCESNYCGGCNAVWYNSDGAVVC